MAEASLLRTPLYAEHVALGARLVEFGGWEMPVQYRGILEEHQAVRQAAGLFDLGHMGQVLVSGPDALAYLNWVATNDVASLEPGEAHYSLLCRPDGGVVDDILIYRLPRRYLVVINAANINKDLAWLRDRQADAPRRMVTVADASPAMMMLALQGPRAAEILRPLTDVNLDELASFHAIDGHLLGVPTVIARTGYTGEDGFEFYFPVAMARLVWVGLLAAGQEHGLQPIGLGARDTLRLEAKMALYGHELSDSINPYEARLGWAVKLEKGAFVGSDALAAINAAGPSRKLVGFKLVGRGIPRADYPIVVDGQPSGWVTSGTMSPTLNLPIGLGLIKAEHAGVGRPLSVMIRDRPIEAVQIPTPFYRRPRAQ